MGAGGDEGVQGAGSWVGRHCFVSPGQQLSAQEKVQVCVKKGIQPRSGWQVAGSTQAPVCLLAPDLSHLIVQASGL